MVLVSRGDKTALPLLEKLTMESANPLARLHALCIAETPAAVLRALGDRHPGVRENALRIAERYPTVEMIAAAAKLVDDPDAKVRLQLALTLGEWKDAVAGDALAQLALRDHAEPCMVAAVMSSALPHARVLFDAVMKAGGEPLKVFGPLLEKMLRAPREAASAAVVASAPRASLPLPAMTADRAEVIKRFQPALKLTGNPVSGRAIFTQLCVACHRLGETGNEVGPNLVSVAGHPPEKLLVNILDPSADVQPGYYAYRCRVVGGDEIYGLIATETANSVTFKLPDGTSRAVLRKEIASLESTRTSLMPAGLEAGLDEQKLADLIAFLRAGPADEATPARARSDIRVGAAAVNLKSTDDMPLAGSLEARFTKEQEGELRATAVVIEKPGAGKVAIVACDVLWVTRAIVDAALAEIEQTTGIPSSHVLVNATHTHHAPGTAPAHAFGWSEKFADEVRRGIVQSVQEASARMSDAAFFFQLGEERTVGANSRLLLGDGAVSWLNPLAEAGAKVQPTDPFDPQLPVLDFRAAEGKSRAVIFNHSTHTIGTRSGREVRSPSFYGLAAQELEAELGGIVSFLEGASGSTHNIRGVRVPVAIERMKRAVLETRSQAVPHPVTHLASIKRPFRFRVRHFDEVAEAANVARYTSTYAKASATRIGAIFSAMRRELAPVQGEERTTIVQAMRIGDVALVGVPAEYFTALGLEIKRRSPFKNTFIAELANDWIGYLPTREGHALGGYQTWTGLHSYAEPGTGERIADEAVKLLEILARDVD
jgi:putative heme-binding domain-containing protein